MKKFISVMLSILMAASAMSATLISASAAETSEPVYVVAGSSALCGVNWDPSASTNVMTFSDSVYTKVFEDVEPATDLQIKVVENIGDTQNWIGDATGNNITFNVETVSDVTVTYDPATGEITVSGDGVTFKTELVIDGIYAVGNGDEAWLNGVNWDPAAEANKMEEVSEKVYTITFENVVGPYEFNQVKFAANGAWADSWGGVYTESGVAFDADYNGDNINVNVPYELANVTLTLDLTNFDYATKTGAVATITVVEVQSEALLGDVNGDNIVDVKDVTYLQMFLAKYEGVEIADDIADINADGIVDVQDVTAIQYIVAGL